MNQSVLKKGISILAIVTILVSCNSYEFIDTYKGQPYNDSLHTKGVQRIPGNVHLEFYDVGGEGITYHDSDSSNSGSGNLNPADGSYLHEFRINEPVDISFTKSGDIDDTGFNFVDPKMDQLYLGWTSPGEWTKYTVDVEKPGIYQIGLMYTSNRGGSIAIAVNDAPPLDTLVVTSTYVEADTVSWRQWHHWNYDEYLGKVKLKKGRQVITLYTITEGNMNYDYLSFTPSLD